VFLKDPRDPRIGIGEFSWTEEKLNILRRFHRYISDRENLNKMIEDKFNFFDQDKARQIVGL